MTDVAEAYDVVVPPELAVKWAALPSRDQTKLSKRLRRVAKFASSNPVAWPVGPEGVHRGKHRAIVDELWLLYRRNDDARTVSVIGFGHV